MFGETYAGLNLIFCRPDGNYYNPDNLSCRVTELATKAGLKGAGLHSLRHSHVSELLSNGVPIATVSKRVGHANPNITLAIYAHALEADELAAAKIWDDAMANVISSNQREPKRMLAIVSADGKVKPVNHSKERTGWCPGRELYSGSRFRICKL
jgi:Phage integrase family